MPLYQPTDEDRIKRAEFMRDEAERNEEYQERCVLGEKVFYHPDTEARIPGHIYSDMGMKEYVNLSHLCEYHFDEITRPPDDE